MSKLALLIGINYIGTPNKLNGCQNDILRFTEVLTYKYGYKKENMVSLMDRLGYKSPIKNNIILEMNNLVEKSNKNKAQEIFLYYSGHGTTIFDRNNDEVDRRDECLVPLDYDKNGIISDDDIYTFLSKLYEKSKITCIFDCCNSASNSDLPISYLLKNGKVVKENYSKKANLNKNIIIISGCADNNVSYDAVEPNGTPCGILSYSIRKTLENNAYTCNIKELLYGVTKEINKFKLQQVPVISVGSDKILPESNIFKFDKNTAKNVVSNIPVKSYFNLFSKSVMSMIPNDIAKKVSKSMHKDLHNIDKDVFNTELKNELNNKLYKKFNLPQELSKELSKEISKELSKEISKEITENITNNNKTTNKKYNKYLINKILKKTIKYFEKKKYIQLAIILIIAYIFTKNIIST
jgi:hypothetical protein